MIFNSHLSTTFRVVDLTFHLLSRSAAFVTDLTFHLLSRSAAFVAARSTGKVVALDAVPTFHFFSWSAAVPTFHLLSRSAAFVAARSTEKVVVVALDAVPALRRLPAFPHHMEVFPEFPLPEFFPGT